MDKDRVLKELVKQDRRDKLSYEFENRVMSRVFHEVEKRERRGYYLGLILISAISVIMVVSSTFVIKYFFETKIIFPELSVPVSQSSMTHFYVFIAFIALFLLFMDMFIRRTRNIKRLKQEADTLTQQP